MILIIIQLMRCILLTVWYASNERSGLHTVWSNRKKKTSLYILRHYTSNSTEEKHYPLIDAENITLSQL